MKNPAPSNDTGVVTEQHPGLVAALIAAKREFAPATKNAINPHFKNRYVDLDGTLAACEEALGNHGLAVIQTTDASAVGGAPVLITELVHVSGECRKGQYPLSPAKLNDPQALGACLTYARRYSYMAILGIAPTDDDGNEASGRGEGNGPKAPHRAPIARDSTPTGNASAPIATSAPVLVSPAVSSTDGKITPGEVQRLQIAIKGLPLVGNTDDEKRSARINWLRTATGRPEIESTKDVLRSEFDNVIKKASAK